ncbi:hypothetical protein AB0J83_41465 [Actinoplanes sp. NPDC049596]|uniref:hypothetical protein n=1 Tax=unclassified Actinoplanes TaxID=2626549 RepID=UPI0034379B82
MPNVAGAIFSKNASISWDGQEFLGNTTMALLTPDTPITQERTLDPGYVLSDVDDPTWTFQIRAVQAQDGLTDWLFEHQGEEVEIVYTPKRGAGNNTYTFTIVVTAVPIGGERGSFATVEATFPVIGQPVKGTAV